MKLEATIQYMFDNYPSLYQTRKQALDHLFCTIGNGYEWIDGELVAYDDDKNYVAILDDNGKAKPRADMVEKEIIETYNELLDYNKEKRKDLDILVARVEKGEIDRDTLDQAIELFDTIYPIDEETLMKRARKFVDGSFIYGSEDRSMKFYPLSESSRIFTMPADVKPDWLEGVKEIVGMLLVAQQSPDYDYGFGDNPNEWQKSERAKWTNELWKLARELKVIE